MERVSVPQLNGLSVSAVYITCQKMARRKMIERCRLMYVTLKAGVNLRKMLLCRSFSVLKTLTDWRSFSRRVVFHIGKAGYSDQDDLSSK